MKFCNYLASCLILLTPFSITHAQKLIPITDKTITLSIKQESGTNGNAVVYNADKQLYYASYAGNSSYPLETFDANGNNLHQGKTGVDVRGLWWNPKTKDLETNAYKDGGLFIIKTDSRGYGGVGSQNVYSGQHQPDDNSCGDIGKKGDEIFFLNENWVYSYDRETGEKTSRNIKLDIPTNLNNINYTSFIYTGKKKMEVGVLNYAHNEVYLFNLKNGSHTGTIKLPSDAETNYVFRFSYANGYIFLYDKESRSWTGYQVFE